MSTISNSPRPDLSSLRINRDQRARGKTGKFLGVVSAILGLAVVITGAIFAFHNQTPVVEVAAGQKAAAGRH